MKRQILFVFAISFFAFWGCKPNMEKYEVKPSASNGRGEGGPANFSSYIALGNSLTAGYSDGALYDEGQRNSYPALIAQQLKTVGGGNFTIPFIGTERGLGPNPSGSTTVPFVTKLGLQYVTDCKGVTSLSPKAGPADANDIGYAITRIPGPYNNMRIPGAKSFHLGAAALGKDPSAGGNIFYYRIATDPGNSTVLGDAVKLNASFFSLWIGNNDVLGFATDGGENGSTITDQATFQFAINQCLDSLTKNGAKGIIGNIPDVTAIPYCTTIPYNGLVLTSATQVAGLNAAYASFGLTFTLGQNPFVVSGAGGVPRFIKSNEYMLLVTPQDSLKCGGWGSSKPIADRYFLDEGEITQIKTATDGYNSIIATLAESHHIAVVDMNTNLKKLAAGINFDGVLLNSVFVQGGAFSLDGVHLTPRGNAAVANYFIESINNYYGSSIPTLNVGQYRGVVFP